MAFKIDTEVEVCIPHTSRNIVEWKPAVVRYARVVYGVTLADGRHTEFPAHNVRKNKNV